MFWVILLMLGKSHDDYYERILKEYEEEMLNISKKLDEVHGKKNHFEFELAKLKRIYSIYGETAKLDKQILDLKDKIDCYEEVIINLQSNYKDCILNYLRNKYSSLNSTESKILKKLDEVNQKKSHYESELEKLLEMYNEKTMPIKLEREIQMYQDIIICYKDAKNSLKHEYATYLTENILKHNKFDNKYVMREG